MAAKDNSPTPPGSPPGSPSPGIDICKGCIDFANCEKWVAQGLIPNCAGPNANNNAGLGGGTQTKPGSSTTPSNAAANASTNPVDTALSSIIPPGFFGTIGQQIGLMLLALSLTAVGLYLLFSQQINKTVGKVV